MKIIVIGHGMVGHKFLESLATGGAPNLLYIDGKPSRKLSNEHLVDELEKAIRARLLVDSTAATQ